MPSDPPCAPHIAGLTCSSVQWRVEQEDGAWVLRNVATGHYLGVEGEAGDGTPVVAVSEPFRWDIWPDEEDSSTFRCVSVTASSWSTIEVGCGRGC